MWKGSYPGSTLICRRPCYVIALRGDRSAARAEFKRNWPDFYSKNMTLEPHQPLDMTLEPLDFFNTPVVLTPVPRSYLNPTQITEPSRRAALLLCNQLEDWCIDAGLTTYQRCCVFMPVVGDLYQPSRKFETAARAYIDIVRRSTPDHPEQPNPPLDQYRKALELLLE